MMQKEIKAIQVEIATAGRRTSTTWKNKSVTWGELCGRLLRFEETDETPAEWARMSKEERNLIKDRGGFVGGYLRDGKRKAANVVRRRVLCLDADNAAGMLDTFGGLFDTAAVCYSTHSHTGDKPRLRLVILLDRHVTPLEYEALARLVAGSIGLEYFDPTTFEPSRLMYWPTCSKGAERVALRYDGPPLCVDDELNACPGDWHDPSCWPGYAKEVEAVRATGARMEDPTVKKSVVGDFCRAYTIEEAIETFLADKYVKTHDGRYTYTGGSSVGGLATYEHKFAYSHHSSDPASGELLNAFDLVRIHLYGAEDENARSNTSATSMPSYKAMAARAMSDSHVAEVAYQRRKEESSALERGLAEAIEASEGDVSKIRQAVKASLRATPKGVICNTIGNCLLVLDNDPAVKGLFAYDVLAQRRILTRNAPWRDLEDGNSPDRFVRDADDSALFAWVEANYDIDKESKITHALSKITDANRVNPFRDWLDTLAWDGTPRLDTLLVDYLGAADNPYTRCVMRKELCAAVARQYTPGVKFDHMIVLVGPQGIGKSQLISRLGRQWYGTITASVDAREGIEQLQGRTVLEFAEMASMTRSEDETMKAYVTRTEDSGRKAYGRNVETHPRRCVFFGTTNNRDFLRDPTGNRRYLPIDCGVNETHVFDMDPETVAQVWAEAKELWRRGERLYLHGEEANAALNAQREHAYVDERASEIAAFIDRLRPANWAAMSLSERVDWLDAHADGPLENDSNPPCCRLMAVCAKDIYAEWFRRPMTEFDKRLSREINDILRTLPVWREISGPRNFPLWGSQRGFERVM